MSSRRTRLLSWGGSIFLVVAVVGFALFSKGDDDLDRRLIGGAKRIMGDVHLRRTHVKPPLRGTTGERIAPELAELKKGAAAFEALPEEVKKRCTDVRSGVLPFKELPAECLRLLQEGLPAATRLLEASHAEFATAPDELRPWSPSNFLGRSSWHGVQHALRLGVFEARHELADGNPDRAADLCADMLGTGRDAFFGNDAAILGRIYLASTFASCAEALPKIGNERLSLLRQQLIAISHAVPTVRLAIEDEHIFTEIALFGRYLRPEVRAALPPQLQALSTMSAPPFALVPWAPIARFFIPGARRDFRAMTDARLRATRLPQRARMDEFVSNSERLRSSLNLITRLETVSISTTGPSYDLVVEPYLYMLAELDLLTLAAIVEQARRAGKEPTDAEIPGLLKPLSDYAVVVSRSAMGELELSLPPLAKMREFRIRFLAKAP